MCTYCLLKDDMPFCFRFLCDGSQSKHLAYFFFQKANKNGSDDFNLEVTEK